MATNLDILPFYDILTKASKDYMSNVWTDSLATYHQTLTEYLSQFGIFISVITTAQRDSIQSPKEGQLIYNIDAIPGPPRTAEVQVWQVKADVGAWRVFTTTP